MASGGKERRMVFDIRGRRKHVVKFVYAILALLMGASLFLVVGPVNIGNLLGNESSSTSTVSIYEEQAERIERKLKKSPEDEQLLIALTRTRLNAGKAAVETNSAGETGYTVESVQQFQKASAAWSEYLEVTEEPSATTAALMAQALFLLAQASRTTNEAEANIKAAAEAQAIVAEQRPSLNSLSTAALYTMYTFDYKAANQFAKEAEKLATNKFQRENFENQLEEVEKRAKEFQKQTKEAEKVTKGQGKSQLENPFGGLGGSSGLTE